MLAALLKPLVMAGVRGGQQKNRVLTGPTVMPAIRSVQ
ncbi:hypothetical protein I547_5872 [Mycobacterium kansasii 824]|nr:hypothetical protein I547_5872 [Mycobacterium kansasii 824]